MKNYAENVRAGFWVRFAARLIDFLIIAFFSNLVLFFSVTNDGTSWKFKVWYLFYIWSFFTALLVFIVFVLIPILTQGWSIGYKLCKIKVVSNSTQPLWSIILKREILYGISWTLIILLSSIVINNSLIFKISSHNPNIKLTTWEQTRLSIVASISSLLFLVQAFVAITIIANKNKLGFHDKATESFVIFTNKKHMNSNTTIKRYKKLISPKKIVNKPVEWIKGVYEE